VEKTQVKIEPMLEEVIRRNASDLHLQVGLPPTLRVDGALKVIADAPKLTAQDMEQLAFSILDEEQKRSS